MQVQRCGLAGLPVPVAASHMPRWPRDVAVEQTNHTTEQVPLRSLIQSLRATTATQGNLDLFLHYYHQNCCKIEQKNISAATAEYVQYLTMETARALKSTSLRLAVTPTIEGTARTATGENVSGYGGGGDSLTVINDPPNVAYGARGSDGGPGEIWLFCARQGGRIVTCWIQRM